MAIGPKKAGIRCLEALGSLWHRSTCGRGNLSLRGGLVVMGFHIEKAGQVVALIYNLGEGCLFGGSWADEIPESLFIVPPPPSGFRAQGLRSVESECNDTKLENGIILVKENMSVFQGDGWQCGYN